MKHANRTLSNHIRGAIPDAQITIPAQSCLISRCTEFIPVLADFELHMTIWPLRNCKTISSRVHMKCCQDHLMPEAEFSGDNARAGVFLCNECAMSSLADVGLREIEWPCRGLGAREHLLALKTPGNLPSIRDTGEHFESLRVLKTTFESTYTWSIGGFPR